MGLTLADGQLASSLATILSNVGSDRVSGSFYNTSGSLTETVAVSFQRAGGTGRQIARAVLSPRELLIVQNIPIEKGDILQASTSDAATVDYLITSSSGQGSFSVLVLDQAGLPKSKQIVGISSAINNLTATTNPGVSNDNTQGYAVGSVWINTTLQCVWMNLSAATGAAVWLLDGIVPGTGVEPAGVQTQFGGALVANPQTAFAQFTEEGNLYRQVGNPIAGNGADATDDILGGIVLPASAFDQAGRGLNVTAQGKTGATANAGKRIKLWLNPTMAGQTVTAGVISGGTVTAVGGGVLLLDSLATAINAKGWSLQGNLFKIGAGGANTQYFQGSVILDTVHGGIQMPLFPVQPENAVMNIVVTGASAQSGANDIVLNFLEVNAMN